MAMVKKKQSPEHVLIPRLRVMCGRHISQGGEWVVIPFALSAGGLADLLSFFGEAPPRRCSWIEPRDSTHSRQSH